MDGIYQNGPNQETPAQRATRIEREAAVIRKAHAEIDAGLGIDLDDLEAWFDQLEIDRNAPMPKPGSPVN